MNGQRVFVDSACITSIAFSAQHNVLQLKFRDGLAYEYFGVSAALYEHLLAAQSKGAFVACRQHSAYAARVIGSSLRFCPWTCGPGNVALKA